ncbi:uncharacterized protein KD926_011662 [Aspergillus affinis]|uniref:uncharacterized protein n=1 Tax=Aspergillus affinis TaxID=1070780 RepID=UPI0022FF12A9|nr:uncharacterized protein KD926_011662 [Aspergillus affinis]KAI9044692.1 hypothetical protein KD926_011662 [Aspergillus affinis]
MLSSLVLLTPLLAGQGLAAHFGSHLAEMEIFKRQSDSEAFVPGTTPGCPSNWPMCGTSGICYNPKQGQTCCPGGKYACPANSFCLQAPYCCPDGLDPETCAQRYGITLSPSSTEEPVPEPTDTSVPTEPTPEPTDTVEPTVSQPTGPEPTDTVTEPTATEPEPTETAPEPTTSNPVIPKPPTSTEPSVPSSTANPTQSTATPSTPLFTGGANAKEVAGGVAIALGGLGLLGNLI